MLEFEEPKALNRIAIFGRPGSGKSTFALKLSQQLGLPLHHVDKIFFKEYWVKQDNEVFLNLLQSIIQTSQWIIDGNSLKSLEMRYATADLVILFMLPRWKCFLRILKRRFERRNPKIDDRAPDCPERIGKDLIQYTWTFKKRLWPLLDDLKKKYPDTKLIVIPSDREARILLDKLKEIYKNSI